MQNETIKVGQKAALLMPTRMNKTHMCTHMSAIIPNTDPSIDDLINCA
jgi:hypothetical protein